MKKIIFVMAIFLVTIFLIRPFFAFVFDPSEIFLMYDGIKSELSDEDQKQITDILSKKPFLMKHFVYFKIQKYGWNVSDKIHLSVCSKTGIKYQICIYPEFGGVFLRTNPYNAYLFLEDNDAKLFTEIIDKYAGSMNHESDE